MKPLLLLVLLFSSTAGAVSYEQSFQSLGDGPDQYANLGAFPGSASDGELAMDQSSGTLYVWNSGAWQVVGAPGLITAIGALNGQAKNANAGTVSGNTIYMQSADATWPGVLTASDWSTFNSKEPAITAGTALQYWRGDKTFQTLDTAAVPENTNLYFTGARAIGSTLTGYSAGAGIVSAADSVLSAIQKLDGNIAAKFTLPALTLGSVLFSDGSTIAQDNTNFFWDDTGNILRLRGDKYRFGYTDPFSRNALWAYDTDQVILLGSWQSDGLPTNSKSEGIIVYGDEPLTSTAIGAADGAYARVKPDRFGLFSVASGLPAYAGGQYFYRVDAAGLYLRDNAGAKTFEITRSSGQIDTVLGAGVVHSDASGILSSSPIVNADMANMANNTIKGNDSGGAAAPQDLTGTEVTALLDTFTAGLKGLAPASGGGTSNFLRADGTWAAPSGAGDVVGPAGATDEALVRYDGTTGKLIQNSTATLTDAGVLTASSFVGPLTGNSSTATALAANPTDCAAGTKATAIDASGNLTCSAVALAADVSGTLPTGNGGYGTDIQEAATGSINNSNTAFTLSQTPVSAASVALYKNGRLLIQGTDYTIAGANITMTAAPDFAELLRAVYRY